MNLVIPEAALEQHFIVLGKTGSGKSSTLRYVVEHLLERNHRVVVVTAKSDWWGLKLAADGHHAGFPVVVFGGEHQDMPLSRSSGKTIAELLGTGDRSAVIQMRDFMPAERNEFWIDFASHLFRLLKGKLFLVIDEVHNFAPKGKVLDKQAGMVLHWSNKLASEARGLGITLLAASQRAAKVHNDFLTSCETLIAMRVTTHWDREAVEAWIEGCGDEKRSDEILNSLAQMKRGDAWVWSPEIEFGPKQIHFPMFTTYDSFKPQAAASAVKLKGWAEVDLGEVKKRLEAVVREAEANDPAKLKARIREMEIQIRQQDIRGRKSLRATPAEGPDQRAAERAAREMKAQSEKIIATIHASQKALVANGVRMAKDLAQLAERAAKAFDVKLPKIELPKIAIEPATQTTRPLSPQMSLPRRVTNISAVESDGKLRAGAERMLAALAQWHPGGMSEGQMGSHAGLKKSGTFSAYMSDLRRGTYIEERDGEVFATQRGLDYCEHVPAAPSTTEEVLAVWNPKLRDGARRMLDVLVGLRGEAIGKEDLGEQAGLRKSGTFSAYLSDLRTARLATANRDGTIAANKETLFL